jgi:hypothetical protein
VATVRPLFVSTDPPDECGPATFTRDSADAFDLAARERVSASAVIQKSGPLRYDDLRMVHVIDNNRRDAYRPAAEMANDSLCDIVSLPHEFGLYAGEWRDRVLEFVRACRKPEVGTQETLGFGLAEVTNQEHFSYNYTYSTWLELSLDSLSLPPPGGA